MNQGLAITTGLKLKIVLLYQLKDLNIEMSGNLKFLSIFSVYFLCKFIMS